MKMPAYSEITPTSNTKVLGYEATDPESTHVYNASELGSSGGVNIYNSDGSITDPRTVDIDGNSISFVNGNFLSTSGNATLDIEDGVGSSISYIDPSVPRSAKINAASNFQVEITSSLGANINKISVNNGQVLLSHNDVPYVIFRSIAVPSSMLEIYSTTRGSRPFPLMTTAQRDAIASPVIGLMVYVTDGTEGIYVRKSSGWTFVA